MTNERRWEQPHFKTEPPKEPPHISRLPLWGKLLLGAGGVAVGIVGVQALGHSNPQPSEPFSPAPASATTPSSFPSVPESSPSATATGSASASPTPETHPTPVLPDVHTLEGNVGYLPVDKSSGFLWGRARTSDKINIMTLRCKDDTPSVKLYIVDEDNTITKQYKSYAYPEASPNPCDGDTVRKSIAQSGKTLGYYSLFLSVSIINGTLG